MKSDHKTLLFHLQQRIICPDRLQVARRPVNPPPKPKAESQARLKIDAARAKRTVSAISAAVPEALP